jgi:AcrR family transcriptional regulator
MSRKNLILTLKTHDLIIAGAYELFLEHGFHGTSMRQIAQRAGVVVGALYNHFQGKEAVYQAVLLAHHPFHKAFPALAEARGDTAEEYLRDAARRLVASLGSEREFLRLMFIEVVEFDNRHLAAIIAERMPQLQQFVQGLYARRGALRAFAPVVILRSFVGLFFSYFITEIMITPYLPKEFTADVFDSFVDIYLRGILAAHPGPAE